MSAWAWPSFAAADDPEGDPEARSILAKVHEGTIPIGTRSSSGERETLLMLAVTCGLLAEVGYLIEVGEEVNAVDGEGLTPILIAAQGCNRPIVEYLLDHGAIVNAKDSYGTTPLIIATNMRDMPLLRLLVDHGADVNMASRGGTPLIYAAATANMELIEFLLQHGADVHATTDHGSDALSRAVEYDCRDVVRLLVSDYGARLQGTATLTYAMFHRYCDMIRLLIRLGVDLRANGFNSVETAVALEQPVQIQLLLAAGADFYPTSAGSNRS